MFNFLSPWTSGDVHCHRYVRCFGHFCHDFFRVNTTIAFFAAPKVLLKGVLRSNKSGGVQPNCNVLFPWPLQRNVCDELDGVLTHDLCRHRPVPWSKTTIRFGSGVVWGKTTAMIGRVCFRRRGWHLGHDGRGRAAHGAEEPRPGAPAALLGDSHRAAATTAVCRPQGEETLLLRQSQNKEKTTPPPPAQFCDIRRTPCCQTCQLSVLAQLFCHGSKLQLE